MIAENPEIYELLRTKSSSKLKKLRDMIKIRVEKILKNITDGVEGKLATSAALSSINSEPEPEAKTNTQDKPGPSSKINSDSRKSDVLQSVLKPEPELAQDEPKKLFWPLKNKENEALHSEALNEMVVLDEFSKPEKKNMSGISEDKEESKIDASDTVESKGKRRTSTPNMDGVELPIVTDNKEETVSSKADAVIENAAVNKKKTPDQKPFEGNNYEKPKDSKTSKKAYDVPFEGAGNKYKSLDKKRGDNKNGQRPINSGKISCNNESNSISVSVNAHVTIEPVRARNPKNNEIIAVVNKTVESTIDKTEFFEGNNLDMTSYQDSDVLNQRIKFEESQNKNASHNESVVYTEIKHVKSESPKKEGV